MGSNFEEGISRARSKENDNGQKSGKSNSGTPKRKISQRPQSNPTSGGGINRPLKSGR